MLMDKKLRETTNSKRSSQGKTWSRDRNSRLPFGVNVILNLLIAFFVG